MELPSHLHRDGNRMEAFVFWGELVPLEMTLLNLGDVCVSFVFWGELVPLEMTLLSLGDVCVLRYQSSKKSLQILVQTRFSSEKNYCSLTVSFWPAETAMVLLRDHFVMKY